MSLCATWRSRALPERMSIGREESLFLTVSEDHRKREYPEYVQRMSAPFERAGGMAAVYEGVILGGADKIYGLDELNLWLRRHRYAAYDMDVLLPIAHLCTEHAVRAALAEERPGAAVMAEQAAGEILRGDLLRYRRSSRGWMYIYDLTRQFPAAATEGDRRILKNFNGFEEMLAQFDALAARSGTCKDARSLVELAALLYRKIFIRYFAPDHNQDILPERETEEWESAAEPGDIEWTQTEQRELQYDKAGEASGESLTLPDDALDGIPEYLVRNFGPGFRTEQEMEEIESAVCTGIHEERKLLFTDGLSAEAYEGNEPRAQSLRASRESNLNMLKEHEDAARQGIRSIEQAFRNALSLRSEPEIYRADHGVLRNSALWKVGRCENPQLFEKIVRQEPSAVVVELLIDASGSQSVRQSMVALQSYLFSAALSRIRIPHRVMSYCTYGNYTVLRRFRDYDDKSEADRRILEYRATSNNRDGLALAAAGLDLKKRHEEHKIVIVFSDGLPNDMVSGRKREGTPETYVGDAAIRDTCFQVRKLRREGARVIGIFLGEDGELENERMIYGASFLRIRRAEDFAGSAGRRLSETLLNL